VEAKVAQEAKVDGAVVPAIGVYAYNNGANGVFDNCNVFLGTVGLGGTGAAGGAGGLGAAGGVGPCFWNRRSR
jgi:hypothetical protein